PFGSTNILSPVISVGGVFPATIQTNGVTAALASGSVTFQTNSVALSVNTVAAGSASSATAVLNPPYTVTAIYSGDSTYIGSTNTLTVNNATAQVIFGSLLQTNNGTPRPVTVTTVPG